MTACEVHTNQVPGGEFFASSDAVMLRSRYRGPLLEDERMLPLDTIICGDNVATMATFPDACIDLVVTSPPYDNLRTYGGHAWDFEGVAQQLWRIIKPGGVVVWVVADATIDGSETGTSFRQALRFMEIGFRLHDTMIYHRQAASPSNTSGRYWQNFEYMFVFSNGTPAATNLLRDKKNTYLRSGSNAKRQVNGSVSVATKKSIENGELGYRENVWRFACGGGLMGDNGHHPATFPEQLARDHILSWSNEKEIVLDPFNGSGTTTKIAKHNGRRYIGIEINPEYVEISNKRLAQGVLF